MRSKTATDEQLLTSGNPEDFGGFYDRHVDTLLGWFARRTGDPEAAADLTAETFAAALAARPRFHAREEPATEWLHALARAALEDFARDRDTGLTAERLGVERPALQDADRMVIARLAREAALAPVRSLPADPRDAIHAVVVEEEGTWR